VAAVPNELSLTPLRIIINIIPVPDIFQVVSYVIHHILGEFSELFTLHDGL
jgi:hypothetical protein